MGASVDTYESDFDNASVVESIVWQMKLADYPRGLNRAKINDTANGVPPYTDDEVADNHIEFNVNPLGLTKLAHDGRSQFTNAFTKPGRFFTATTDSGPVHKREEWNTIVNRNITRPMKRSLLYFETMRSKFAQLILHGISPCAWKHLSYGGYYFSELWMESRLATRDRYFVQTSEVLNVFKQVRNRRVLCLTPAHPVAAIRARHVAAGCNREVRDFVVHLGS